MSEAYDGTDIVGLIRWLIEEGLPDWVGWGPPPPDDANHATVTVRFTPPPDDIDD